MIKQRTSFGFIKVAAAVPPLRIADIDYNVKHIITFAKKAIKGGASIVVFPELSITGYTCADLFQQRALLAKTIEGLHQLKQFSKNINILLVVGMPFECEGKLLNTAVLIFGGKILGIVPKTHIPGYKEFYEERWFASARDLHIRSIKLFDDIVPIGTDLLFSIAELPGAIVGVEICEDLWVPTPPSSYQALHGATIIANLSASNELVGKAEYRKQLVEQQSARCITGYMYAGAGVHESTTDVVFGGHAIIAENGSVLKESKRFKRAGEVVIGEIDIEHLITDRVRTTTFGAAAIELRNNDTRFIEIPLSLGTVKKLERRVDAYPFVPQNASELDKRSEEIFAIQTSGLAKRLEYARITKVVIGLSGGLDSTLALLVAVQTMQLLNLPLKNIHAITMPGFATTKRTKSNAIMLANALGVTLDTVNINKGVAQHLRELQHNGDQDITYQNAQARYRTMILMNKANQMGGLVVGTGDLSEIALGWCTFNGDHISHYNVNAGVPKTLVHYLVNWIGEQAEFLGAKKVLQDILATPISPELVRDHKSTISQKTEALIGPYALHDFFLYHCIRWGSSPSKILFLAKQGFSGQYYESEIKKWLKLFLERFFKNQWKRSVMPDGPKVGSVSLSPRGDWRMSSDAETRLWLKEIEK